ncbi:urease accessory protein UreE [Bifidobacterium vansinderenii]|uniref:Urease accessory protein UreE n=1 Tax=Bifidobacterium vansinderenii TaxID=1984871 RepID=A0A229VVM2_9BIFI|nr:urease accessory protein UreE [Bifidobacterium vansinderenii]OXM99668.1 urease accessory protein UreE [Bifidobacterium vansinderenii]
MIADHITGNIIENPPKDGKLSVPIDFEWFETDKKRMAKVAEDGTEFGVMVGRTIKDGDVLAETDDKRYYAKIKTAQLIEIPVSSMKEMGRLCFELGNRHLSLKVESDRVLVPYDHPTMEYTKKIGFEPHIIEGGFDGFLIVKAHAGSGTIIPGTNKTTGDLAEEEQEAAADKDWNAAEAGHGHDHDHDHTHDHGEHAHGGHAHADGEYEANGVLHRPDGSHSHDGGRTWHTH